MSPPRPGLVEHRPSWGQGLRQLAEALLPDDPDGIEAVLAGAEGHPLFLEQLVQAHSKEQVRRHRPRSPGVGVTVPAAG